MAPHFDAHLTAEANHHLGQLDLLLSQEGPPDPSRLLSLATALRQTATLADAETVAAVAERLEDTARSIIDRNVIWSGEIRWLVQQTVGDLKLVLRALDRWGEDEESRMRGILSRWDEVEESDALPRRQGVPFAADPDYRQRLARAQAGAGESAEGEPPGISRYFYDDGGPHVVSEPDEPEAEDADQDDPLPMLGELPGFGDARIGLDAQAALHDEHAGEADFEAAHPRAESEAKVPARSESGSEGGAPVPIGQLLYRGADALREARALEPRIRSALRGEAEGGEELVAELFDLLELAADTGGTTE